MSSVSTAARPATTYPMLIGAALVAGEGDVIAVENPATEEVFARVPGASKAQIDQAIGAARAAFDSGVWSDLPRETRAAHVRRLLDAIASRRSKIMEVIFQETGVPVGSMVAAIQLDSPLKVTRDHVELYLSLPEYEDTGVAFHERFSPNGAVFSSVKRYAPIGVVSAIAAYNFPLFTGLWKIIPALVTGNTVILRPSPLTPLSALVLGEAVLEAGLPPGVLNIVAEAGADGAVQMTTDRRVDMVTFTGSTQVGVAVQRQAADTLKRVQLELGGKSAQIYLADSIDRAAMAGLSVCLSHAGQGCVLGTRILVPEADKARVIEMMVKAMENLKVGDPSDPSTQMGPVINAAQRERCERYVKLAVEAGATVKLGGKRPAHLSKGYFFEPTILDLPDNKNPAAQDEIFGPVVGVIGYRDVDHAVEMANDTIFGLSGYVYGRNAREAADVARRMRTGTVNVNTGGMSAHISGGGWGMSGIGRERGVEGLRIYQNLQLLNMGS